MQTRCELHQLEKTHDQDYIIPTLLFILISSCMVTKKGIIGLYKLDRFPKTTLTTVEKLFEKNCEILLVEL